MTSQRKKRWRAVAAALAAGEDHPDINETTWTVHEVTGPEPEPAPGSILADPAFKARAAEARERMRRRQVTPDGWDGLDVQERLRWLVENTEQVLVPRPPFMRFRVLPKGELGGPFFYEGEKGERIEAERADFHETLRHDAVREVARLLLAGPFGEEIRREAGALLALLDRAAEAREAERPRTELVSHVERLLGSLSAKLLRPDADRSREARARLREGRLAENRRRSEDAARKHAALVRLIAERLRERPGARDTDIARWLIRDGKTSLKPNSLRQLVAKVRRGPAGESSTARVQRRQRPSPTGLTTATVRFPCRPTIPFPRHRVRPPVPPAARRSAC